MTTVQPIPQGFHTITPYLHVYDAQAAIEFYKRAFGATEHCILPGPNNKVMHASVQIGDSILMLSDECREFGALAPTSLGGSPVSIHLYVEDVDAAFEKAVLAGATIEMPVQDMFWGDRYGRLTDPYGHRWSLATATRQVSPEEMEKAMKAMCSEKASV
jgi:PhnB protein